MKKGARRWWRGASHMLRSRLVALFLLLALAMTLVFLTGMQAVMHDGWQELLRPLVNDYIDRLTAEIGTPPSVERAAAIAHRLPLRIRIDGPVVNWSSQAGKLPGALRERIPTEGPVGAGGWHPARMLADGHRIRFRLASLPRDDAPEDRARLIGWSTLLAMLLLVALLYTRVRKLLAPLADIRAGAMRYGAGDFSRPIPLRAQGELGELALQVNGMAEGLGQMLDAKRQLLLAISHELRSPLTRARLNAELVEHGDARDALLRDLAQMRDLISDLLESERLAGGHAALHTEAVSMNDLVRDLVESQFPTDAIRLALDPALPKTQVDPARLRLLLRNLIDNALRHGAGADTPPSVTTSAGADGIVLRVRDHGPGVDEGQLPQLMEAFYRPDSARQRATGGVGLGLYLCRLVARAHGGTLTLSNAHPGLQAEVALPLRRA